VVSCQNEKSQLQNKAARCACSSRGCLERARHERRPSSMPSRGRRQQLGFPECAPTCCIPIRW
jgi:protein subunit release factor A